jgi:aspartyl-tRNA(Asn)/glutamyl-tRNA(Gln) amidotransferase subunit A
MMNERELTAFTASGLAAAVAAKKISAVEVTEAAVARIERLNPKLRAFITVMADRAVEQAKQVQRDVDAGRAGPLAGVPIALKDLIHVQGVRTTAGSKVLADNVAEHDAAATERLTAAGAVIIGKVNMHEFAYGFTNENPHYGDCRNPWDTTRIPGGSSGGSAVATVTSMSIAALGSDTGGSIRLPACLNNIVGLKPTYGRVSKYGVLPLSWSMDHVGPMTKTVEDATVLLGVLAGHDPRDETTVDRPVPDYRADLKSAIRGLRVGVPHEYFMEDMQPEVAAVITEALGTLEKLGARLRDVTIPDLPAIRSAHIGTIFPEAAAWHEPLITRHSDLYGDDVRALVQSGLFFLARHYLNAQQVRRKVVAQWREIFRDFDVLATPISPITAVTIGQRTIELSGKEIDLVMPYLSCTWPFNLSGQPALSVPAGFTPAGLPVGLQLVAKPWQEPTLLRAAWAFENETQHWKRQPPRV